MKCEQIKRGSVKWKGKSYREKLRQRRAPKFTNSIWMLLGKCFLWLTIYLGCFYDSARFGLYVQVYGSSRMLAGEHEELRPCAAQHTAWLGSHISWPCCFPCVPYRATPSEKGQVSQGWAGEEGLTALPPHCKGACELILAGLSPQRMHLLFLPDCFRGEKGVVGGARK